MLSRFYEHVDSPEAAGPHEEWVKKIRAYMQSAGDGSRERPYPAMTAVEAQMYAISLDMSPVGSIYQSSEDVPFSILMGEKIRLFKCKQSGLGILHTGAEKLGVAQRTPIRARYRTLIL